MRRKKWIPLMAILCIVMGIGVISLWNQPLTLSAKEDGGEISEDFRNWRYTLDENGRMEISGNGYVDIAMISEEIREKVIELRVMEGIQSLDGSGFDSTHCSFKNIEKLILPQKMYRLGSGVFAGCSELAEVQMPEKMDSISRYAFRFCKKLEEIKIPDGVTVIEVSAFEGCENLRIINIPETVTVIENHAFNGCRSLGEVALPIGLTSIGEYAFNGCTNLKLETGIPDGIVGNIGERTFSSCYYAFREIIIPKGIKQIGDFAFTGCFMTERLIIPEGVISIGQSAFSPFTNLESVVIPASVTSIGDDAFSGMDMIYVYRGSVGEQYCKANGLNYTVINPLEALAFSEEQYTLPVGQSMELEPVLTPEDAFHKVTVSVKDPEIATYENGVLTAVNEGTTQVTAVSENGLKASCEIIITHSYQVTEIVKEPSCTEPGKQVSVCVGCKDKKEEEIPALGHEWEQKWTVDKQASCTEPGRKSHHCIRCGATKESVEIPMMEHIYKLDEDGISRCEICGMEKIENIESGEAERDEEKEKLHAAGENMETDRKQNEDIKQDIENASVKETVERPETADKMEVSKLFFTMMLALVTGIWSLLNRKKKAE